LIGRLRGQLAHVEGNTVIVDVGGVGYRAMVPVSALTELGGIDSPVTLHTHTYVREDELSLYGFTTPEQLKAFGILISVTGVGPKVALAILSGMDVGSLAHAVSVGDTRTLIKAPGLGPKTAQRLVLELKDKMAALVIAGPRGTTPTRGAAPVLSSPDQLKADIIDALVGLGYNRKDAERAADRVESETEGEPLTSAQALKEALNVLTGNR
jgi:Holliday junction DNA helicase RuvA